jgi:GTP cyclohydrolase II
MTGDLFGSRRCDCGEQLTRSQEIIAKNGGVLIYHPQEGRGMDF